MCDLNETTPVEGKDDGCRDKVMTALERSDRAEAIWWLGQLLCAVTDRVDEETLRVTVIPAARYVLKGLQ